MEPKQQENYLPVDDIKVVAVIFVLMFVFGLCLSLIAADAKKPCVNPDADLPTKDVAPADSQLPADEVDGLPDVF